MGGGTYASGAGQAPGASSSHRRPRSQAAADTARPGQRVAQLEQRLLEVLDEVWDLPHDRDTAYDLLYVSLFGPRFPDDTVRRAGDPLAPLLEQSVQQLAERWPANDLPARVADMYFQPASWQRQYRSADPRRILMLRILAACLVQRPPEDIHDRLAARLELICAHPYDGDERSAVGPRLNYPPESYLPPTHADCLQLLLELPQSAANGALVEQVVLGKFNFGPFDLSGHVRGVGAVRSYDIYAQTLRRYLPRLMERLFVQGRFNYDLFRQAVQHLPDSLYGASLQQSNTGIPTYFHSAIRPDFGQLAAEYCDRLAWEVARQLSAENCHLVPRIQGLRGGRFLVQAARQHSVHRLGKLVVRRRPVDGLAEAVVHLARAEGVEPDTSPERAALVAELRSLPAATLQRLLPVTRHGRPVLCQALGWRRALPLIDALSRSAGLDQVRLVWDVDSDVRNSPDPTLGVLDVVAVRSALRQAGSGLARKVLSLFREARVGVNAGFLISALAGWNRAQVEAGIAKRAQIAIKAYGLLPLSRGEDEALERYLLLEQFARESGEFGPQRQVNERAAVQVALANLAQVGGYGDATQLALALERKLGAEIARPGRSWTAGAYEVRLSLERADPRLVVMRAGRQLKSMPRAVREHAAYEEMKAAVACTRQQRARMRTRFERLMATGQALSRAELESLVCVPVARNMLGALLLRTATGALGLFDPLALAVRGLDGAMRPVGGAATIAHPYHLVQADQWAAWQREVRRRRDGQPFKQVFRELHLPTRAERETGTYSRRYADRVLEPRVATRLFLARGWQIDNHGRPLAYKDFPSSGLCAVFEFTGSHHSLFDEGFITSDRIYFVEYRPGGRRWHGLEENWLRLEAVPPILFSEVLRDADLVVSVAQRDRQAQASAAAYRQRGERARMVLDDLGLPGVTVAGRFVYVEGKLARYRVHLGTAAVQVQPGTTLYARPAQRGQLPAQTFPLVAGEDESLVREVVGKVLQLLHDDRLAEAGLQLP